MSNSLAVREEIQTVNVALEKMRPQLTQALPAHIKPERMIRVALSAIQNTPKLLECDRQSFYLSILRAAQLGLEPDGVLGQAYLIPYGKTVQLIPGYKGLIDLARRSGEVSNIIAKEVCAKDDFALNWHDEVPFRHVQAVSGDRGEVIGFWALARFKDGGFHFDYMTKGEVLTIRDNSSGWKQAVAWSKNPNNKKTQGIVVSPWQDHFIEMGKKTVIRRIAKFLPMSVQRAAAVEDMVDSGKSFAVSEFGDIVIDQATDDAANTSTPTTALDNFSGNSAQAATTPHDPQTGEIIDQPAATQPPAERPTFDIAAYDMTKQQGIKDAVKALCAVLESYPENERTGQYFGFGGNKIVSAANRAGLDTLPSRFSDLGVNPLQE